VELPDCLTKSKNVKPILVFDFSKKSDSFSAPGPKKQAIAPRSANEFAPHGKIRAPSEDVDVATRTHARATYARWLGLTSDQREFPEIPQQYAKKCMTKSCRF
jgi:hypothetical protein